MAYVVEWFFSAETQLIGTDNGGQSWTALSLPSSCGSRAQAVGSGSGLLVVAGEGGSCISSDGGSSWTTLNGNWDNRFAYAWPNETGTFVLGGDQGLYMTSNTGQSWSSLNGGIMNSLDTSVAVNGSTILVAVQDYAVINSLDGGSTWSSSGIGDAGGEDGTVAFNPANPNYAYTCTTGALAVSTNGGVAFTQAQGLPNGPCDNAIVGAKSQLAFDPASPSTMYTGSIFGVFKSTDWGVNWKALPWNLEVQAIAVDPTNSSHILVSGCCTGNDEISYTMDGGQTWNQAALPSAGGRIWTIAIDPSNPSVVLAGADASPGGGGGILLSTDGGRTFVQDNTGIQPSINASYGFASDIEFAPNSQLVVAATSAGIYASLAGSDWQSIQGSIVPVLVTSASWTSPNTLYISTFGEGILRGTLSASALLTSPGAPTAVTGTSSENGEAAITWVPPASNGGTPIISYVVRFSPDNGADWTTATSNAVGSSYTVTGLNNGGSYVFEVAAVNSTGTGAYSSLSNVVTPKAPRPATVVVLFNSKASSLSAAAKKTITTLATQLIQGARVVVTGFARGNSMLARSRAEAVTRLLLSLVDVHVTQKTNTTIAVNKVTVATTAN
ncbi:MAG: fibronectin type III domain-containing protein [Acidimicrobiales bacterium]